MDIKKLAPWNWLKKEEEDTGKTVPVVHGGIGYYECARCAGEGAVSGEMPVSIAYPAGLVGEHAVMIPLERFGIGNLHLTVCFRPTEADRIP